MEDWSELIRKLNQIIGQEGKLTPNKGLLEPGSYVKNQKGSISFALDDTTCLTYQPEQISDHTEQISDQMAELISLLIKKEGKQEDRAEQQQKILIERILNEPYHSGIFAEAKKFGFAPDKPYLPLMVKREVEVERWTEILQSYFSSKVIGTFIDHLGYYLIPFEQLAIEIQDREALEEIGQGLASLFREEGSDKITFAFSEPKNQIENWKTSFEKAKKSLFAGIHFYPEKRVFYTWNMSCEVLLDELSKTAKIEYVLDILGEKGVTSFDSEMYHTLKTFIEENLNISEAARKLFIHRNTLIYRLERIKAEIGRDVRMGDEAHIVSLALLLSKGLQQNNQIS